MEVINFCQSRQKSKCITKVFLDFKIISDSVYLITHTKCKAKEKGREFPIKNKSQNHIILNMAPNTVILENNYILDYYFFHLSISTPSKMNSETKDISSEIPNLELLESRKKLSVASFLILKALYSGSQIMHHLFMNTFGTVVKMDKRKKLVICIYFLFSL